MKIFLGCRGVVIGVGVRGKQKEGVRWTKSTPSTCFTPYMSQQQQRQHPRPEPAAWNPTQVSHMGCRDPTTGAIMWCLPRIYKWLEDAIRSHSWESDSNWGIWLKSQLYCCLNHQAKPHIFVIEVFTSCSKILKGNKTPQHYEKIFFTEGNLKQSVPLIAQLNKMQNISLNPTALSQCDNAD